VAARLKGRAALQQTSICYSRWVKMKLSRDAAFWLITVVATILLTLITWFVSK
jgi:hypothetical protein